MENCIFCKIIKGEIPTSCIYEDESIMIIMNINPDTNGHLLVIPKEHIVNLFDIKNDLINHMLDKVRELYPTLKEKLGCEGLTLAQNNELGQEIKHYHIHLIPRYQNDGADREYDRSNLLPVEEVYNKLKEA